MVYVKKKKERIEKEQDNDRSNTLDLAPNTTEKKTFNTSSLSRIKQDVKHLDDIPSKSLKCSDQRVCHGIAIAKLTINRQWQFIEKALIRQNIANNKIFVEENLNNNT